MNCCDRARAAAASADIVIPLAIMTSDDTDALTRKLLQDNNNFGMAADQLIIFKQGKVRCRDRTKFPHFRNDSHFT